MIKHFTKAIRGCNTAQFHFTEYDKAIKTAAFIIKKS